MREVHEEAGVGARVEKLLGEIPAGDGVSAIYLMTAESGTMRGERESRWLPFAQALSALAFEIAAAPAARAANRAVQTMKTTELYLEQVLIGFLIIAIGVLPWLPEMWPP